MTHIYSLMNSNLPAMTTNYVRRRKIESQMLCMTGMPQKACWEKSWC